MATDDTNNSDQDLSIELRDKYRLEREKRVAANDRRRYLPIEAGSRFDADPLASADYSREPIIEELDVVVIGAGISGLCAAVNLRQAGVKDFRIVDKAADFGGTWYWNRYPGLRCDVESYIYMPLLEVSDYMPSERYVRGPEIGDYMTRIARQNDLYSRALFQTRVSDVEWDEAVTRWQVTTESGDRLSARHVVLATGGLLHRPKLPAIPGIDSFEGHSFHTSRWDYAYTGGDESGAAMDKLADKRVAVIGTGATAIQVVPELAKHAAQLYVVQRTPSIVDERNNAKTDARWWNEQQAASGWITRRRESFEAGIFGLPRERDLVGDQWSAIWGLPDLELPADGTPPDYVAYAALISQYDDAQMERIRRRVDDIVEDPATAEALKPYYTTHCKRPCFSDLYLPAFNRENVTLVNTLGRGLDSISANAIQFDGVSYEVDCIIFATGFETSVSPARAGGFGVRGTGGISLEDRWREGVKTVHGMYLNGFPNLFIAGGLRNAGVSGNGVYTLETQAEHVAEVIAALLEDGVDRFEVTAAAEDEWLAKMAEKSLFDVETTRNCTPGYYNNEGDVDSQNHPLFADNYDAGPMEYKELLRQLRSTRRLSELAEMAGARQLPN
ncbi:MAG: fumarate reductase/succinate dehydrogenase flavoprotein [Subtercola sp.]|nr:fumarate reductase/succinate dehydrogenase flavoprotein [Subtercola sp.]